MTDCGLRTASIQFQPLNFDRPLTRVRRRTRGWGSREQLAYKPWIRITDSLHGLLSSDEKTPCGANRKPPKLTIDSGSSRRAGFRLKS